MFSGNGPFKVVSGELNYKALIDGPGHESLDGWDNQYQSEHADLPRFARWAPVWIRE